MAPRQVGNSTAELEESAAQAVRVSVPASRQHLQAEKAAPVHVPAAQILMHLCTITIAIIIAITIH